MNLEGFWFLLEDFFFGKIIFLLVKYLFLHNSSFALEIIIIIKSKKKFKN
jgi:hypothetical protein